MDVNPIFGTYYRYQFREFLEKRSGESAPRPEARDILFLDTVNQTNPPRIQPPAPQDLGEIKHAAVDRHEAEQKELPERQPIEPVDPKPDSWQTSTAFQYSVLNNFGIPAHTRQLMEAQVRQCKKAGLPCPYKDRNSVCSARFIRCGDRRQFAVKESMEQYNLPHTCNYIPGLSGRTILVVDSERAVRDFCCNTLELFFGIESDRIVLVETAQQAIDTLTRFKHANRHVGLALIATALPGKSGYSLVDELYSRNFNLDVILMETPDSTIPKPSGYQGDTIIVSDRSLVRATLVKPFHSETLIKLLKQTIVGSFSDH